MLSLLQKLSIILKTVKNWPTIILDKIGIRNEFIYTFYSGGKLICRSKTTDINEACVIFSGHEYPPKFLELPNDAIVFDLGVNIGSFIVYLSSLMSKKNITGYGFEPWKDNFELAQRNLSLNGVLNFSLFQEAISGEDTIMKFNIDCGYDAGTLVQDEAHDGNKAYIDAPTRSIESFCREYFIEKIDLLKMDIEGGEYALLEKEYVFLSKHVDCILMEYHNIDTTNNLDKVMGYLKNNYNVTIYLSDKGGGNIFAKRKLM